MRIALDVMGGDHAPQEIVKGAVAAAREYRCEIALVGKSSLIQEELMQSGGRDSNLIIVDAPQVIEMDETPTLAIRQKPDSSIVVGINLLQKGEASAFVSAGNSGAVMAAAFLNLGKAKGIKRPALGTVFSFPTGRVFFLDVGANLECKPEFLVQFAYMGKIYMERVFGVKNPRIGLMSNGSEDTKGTEVVRKAHEMLRKSSDLNFVGNLEGGDLTKGKADVAVTDGFTGNIVLKASEGLTEMVFDTLRKESSKALHLGIAASVLRSTFQAIEKNLDYAEYGGAPLLGVKGNVIIAHGRSEAKAIKNAIGAAKRAVERNLFQAIEG